MWFAGQSGETVEIDDSNDLGFKLCKVAIFVFNVAGQSGETVRTDISTDMDGSVRIDYIPMITGEL